MGLFFQGVSYSGCFISLAQQETSSSCSGESDASRYSREHDTFFWYLGSIDLRERVFLLKSSPLMAADASSLAFNLHQATRTCMVIPRHLTYLCIILHKILILLSFTRRGEMSFNVLTWGRQAHNASESTLQSG